MAILRVQAEGWRVAIQVGDATETAEITLVQPTSEFRAEVFRNISSTCDHGMLGGLLLPETLGGELSERIALTSSEGEIKIPSQFGQGLVDGILDEYRETVAAELHTASQTSNDPHSRRLVVTSAGFHALYSSRNTFRLLARLLIATAGAGAAGDTIDAPWVSEAVRAAMPI